LSDRFPSFADQNAIPRAREAAEAVFKPKQQVSPSEIIAPVEKQRRQPRILSVSKTAESRPGNTPVVTSTTERDRVTPGIEIPRIRTWIKYGMTIAQAAKMYGLTVGELKDLLRQP